MFLNQLSEKEKRAFISLGIHVAKSDGIFVEEEQKMLKEYCKEMEIEYLDSVQPMLIDELVQLYSESKGHIKKIILFELLGLAYSDGKYHDTEKVFISEFAKKIGLCDTDVEKATRLFIKYFTLVEEIVQFLS